VEKMFTLWMDKGMLKYYSLLSCNYTRDVSTSIIHYKGKTYRETIYLILESRAKILVPFKSAIGNRTYNLSAQRNLNQPRYNNARRAFERGVDQIECMSLGQEVRLTPYAILKRIF